MSAEVIPFHRARPAPEPMPAPYIEDVPENEGPPVGSVARVCPGCTERLGQMQAAFYCTRSDVRCWTCHEVQVFGE